MAIFRELYLYSQGNLDMQKSETPQEGKDTDFDTNPREGFNCGGLIRQCSAGCGSLLGFIRRRLFALFAAETCLPDYVQYAILSLPMQ